MKKTALVLMFLTIISKVLGFTREITLSYLYGASALTDAYLVSETIPVVIFSFIGVGIATGFVPMYNRILIGQGEPNARKFTNNLTTMLFFSATIVIAFILVFAPSVVSLFAIGFEGETLRLAVNFTRISVFAIYFTALFQLYAGYLRIHDYYTVSALAGIPLNLIIILFLFISKGVNIYWLPFGSFLAVFVQFAILIPFIRKTGYKFHFNFDLKDENLKLMLMIALPIILGTSVNEINILIDRTLASKIAEGGISALSFSRRLNGFIQSLFVTSIITALYPMISKMGAEGNMNRLKSSISEAIAVVNLLLIPTTLGAMLFSKEVVILLFGRGAFTSEAIIMTSNALFFYSVGMIGIGLRESISRAFYALQDTKTPMINATIGVVVNIVLNFILSKYMGIGGLALATSISAIVTAILMFITLRKKIGPFGLKELLRSFIKISIASLIMGVIAYPSFVLAGNHFSQNLSLILAIGVGALSYAIIIYFMKIPEVDSTIEAVKKKLINRSKQKVQS